MLNDTAFVKSINSKIVMNNDLSSVEVDVFVNIAAAKQDDHSILEEVAKILKRFRRSLSSHTLFVSSHHAVCRLFLESEQLPSLVNLLENRVDFGIFPDAYATNLIFDRALESNQLPLAARTAALMMLQEEFGLSKLSDRFALYSTAKYIESKTNFEDWITRRMQEDPILVGEEAAKLAQAGQSAAEEKRKKEEAEGGGEDDEEEDDSEYHRVPFLRNPYFDNHFDLTNPRAICGKTLTLLGMHLEREQLSELALKCQILGNILHGQWSDAVAVMKKGVQSKLALDRSVSDLSMYYMENLHGVDAPNDEHKKSLESNLKTLSSKTPTTATSISELAEEQFGLIKQDLEKIDIDWMKRIIGDWSKHRLSMIELIREVEKRKKLIEEIKQKKQELKTREDILYFYDKLRNSRLTRVEYD